MTMTWPEEWPRSVARLWLASLLTVAIGGAFLVGGIDAIGSGRYGSAVFSLFVAGILLPLALVGWLAQPQPVNLDGVGQRAGSDSSGVLHFPMRRSQRILAYWWWGWTIALAALGLVAAIITPGWWTALAALVVGALVWGLFRAAASWRRAGVTLDPDGIAIRQWTRPSYVRWEELDAVYPIAIRNQKLWIVLRRPGSEPSWKRSVLIGANGFVSGPLLLLRTLEFYFEQPALRAELTDGTATDRLRLAAPPG